jgi:hypothetical protein
VGNIYKGCSDEQVVKKFVGMCLAAASGPSSQNITATVLTEMLGGGTGEKEMRENHE